MIRRLLETIALENGELYVTINGRRHLLAKCSVKAKIYENTVDVPTLGERKPQIKKYQMICTLCEDMDFTRTVDEDFLASVVGYEICADYWRTDGVFERIRFDRIRLTNILPDSWEFEIENASKIIRRFSA